MECIKGGFNQRGMSGFKLIKYLNRFATQREIMSYYNVFLLNFNPSPFGKLALKDNGYSGHRIPDFDL